ncbi:hypothetical protein N7516_002512 [Penicillium verrucosum]|uniref:uncharacterized protein n=1 Tax=Penicillium verrucosum TaxID=60171 RepID=UPI00254508D0|nr:uncharacterized protein N7516_002512 [Penicillium verrucosum]KAJ5942344.1 hypothetical protein N7516_002512 [Penicillium verrucosum]
MPMAIPRAFRTSTMSLKIWADQLLAEREHEQELATPMGFPKGKAQWETEFRLGAHGVQE